MKRRTVALAAVVALAALVAGACGGSSGPSAATTPVPAAPADPTKVAQLDAAAFDTVVLGSPRPSLVEFHSPT